MSKKKTEDIVIPTAEEAVVLTDRLVKIERIMKRLTEKKKAIEARLEAFALAQPEEHKPLKDEKREGRKVTLGGSRFRLPVVFSSDLLIGSFKDQSPKHQELLKLLADMPGMAPQNALKLFFDPPASWTCRYEDGQKFRKAALDWLPADIAPLFIAACRQTDRWGIAKSKTSFDYKAAEVVEAQGKP